jgi:hypothetical protein
MCNIEAYITLGLTRKPLLMTTSVVASCTCGSFRFKSQNEPIGQLTCHCFQCRQVSKSPSTNFAFFKLAECKLEGETVVHSFTADSGTKTVRETCATCGEILLDRTEGFPQIIGVVADRIQPPYLFQARCHVWVESKCAEVILPEGVKTFARNMQ